MKKTNRKNKTNLIVNWPTGFFVMETSTEHPHVEALTTYNPEFVPITLRVRLNIAIDEKHTTKIGTLKNAKGRPKLVFAVAPVSIETVEAAKNAGVLIDNDVTNVVNVVDVKATESTDEVSTSVEVVHDGEVVPSV